MDEQNQAPQPQAPQPEASDLSSKTITVLVLLTLVVSFLGTFVSLTQLNTLSAGEEQHTSAPTNGKVQFVIAPPEPAETDTATGRVTLAIVPP